MYYKRKKTIFLLLLIFHSIVIFLCNLDKVLLFRPKLDPAGYLLHVNGNIWTLRIFSKFNWRLCSLQTLNRRAIYEYIHSSAFEGFVLFYIIDKLFWFEKLLYLHIHYDKFKLKSFVSKQIPEKLPSSGGVTVCLRIIY